MYDLSSKGATQLQVLFINTLRSIQGNLFTDAAVVKCISSIFFPGNLQKFRTSSEKFALENFVLAYHTADKDHADFL